MSCWMEFGVKIKQTAWSPDLMFRFCGGSLQVENISCIPEGSLQNHNMKTSHLRIHCLFKPIISYWSAVWMDYYAENWYETGSFLRTWDSDSFLFRVTKDSLVLLNWNHLVLYEGSIDFSSVFRQFIDKMFQWEIQKSTDDEHKKCSRFSDGTLESCNERTLDARRRMNVPRWEPLGT